MREVVDLRKDGDATEFWRTASRRVESAKLLVQLQLRPKIKCGLIESLIDSKRMWDLIQLIRKHGFQPMPGDEIMIDVKRLSALNGTRRASILLALGRPVPGLIVNNWQGHITEGQIKWQSKSN